MKAALTAALRAKMTRTTRSILVYTGDATLPFPRASLIPDRLVPGIQLDRYTVIGRLGAGAMGIVLEARDTELDRVVALKLVRPRARDNAQAAQRRLRLEAQAMARLSHANVASVFDIGMVEDQLFIAMELVRGHTLRELVGANHPWREVLTLALAAGRGLAAAHQAGVIHRDFKPDNVLVRDDGAVRVSDFGLARAVQSNAPVGGDAQPTRAEIAGTPSYMAPESFDGIADALTDQYALAVTMYELLEAARPFAPRSAPMADRATLAAERPRAWRRREIPAAVRAAIERGFLADRAARWPSVAELCAAVERGLRATKRTRRLILLAACGLAAAGAVHEIRALDVTQLPPATAPTFAAARHTKLTVSGDTHLPSLSQDGRRLAYVTGNRWVFVRDLQQGDVSQVFEGRSIWQVRWAPDGSQLLVLDRSGLYVVSPGGMNRRQFAVARSAVWSPDSTQLAVYRAWNPQVIDIVDVNTGLHRQERIPFTNELATLPPRLGDWSGGRLLLDAYRPHGGYSFRTMRADGTEPNVLYEDDRITGQPAWADRGCAIYYAREKENAVEHVRLSVDSSQHVTGERIMFSGPGLSLNFSVSDDERQMVYESKEVSSSLVAFSGAQRKVLYADTREQQAVTVSPDGKTIAFIVGSSERGQIVTMSRDGASPTIVPLVDGRPLDVAWSPRGDQLAYTVETAAGRQLWTVTLATGKSLQQRISTLASDIAWTSRGDMLAKAEGSHNYIVLSPGMPERPLVRPEIAGWMNAARPSPDGRYVAVEWNRHPLSGLWVISLEDGSATRVYTNPVYPVGWSKDSAWIFAVSQEDRGGNVLAVDASGTGNSRIALQLPLQPWYEITNHPIHHIDVLPGGDSEQFVAIEQVRRSDLWLATLDERQVATPSPRSEPPPETLRSALLNGAMTEGQSGGVPASWSSFGIVGEVITTVDSCESVGNRCVMLARQATLQQRINAIPYRGRRIRVHARGRAAEDAEIDIWVQAQAAMQLAEWNVFRSANWTSIDFDADIGADADFIVVELHSLDGPGAWFDDVSLELADAGPGAPSAANRAR